MPPVIKDIEILLGAALVVVILFRSLKLPVLAGFLLAGILIGPSGLGLISGTAEIHHIAEIGVVLLLFTIGLDVSLSHLVRHWRAALIAGSVQIALTALAAGGALLLGGLSGAQALLLGLLLAFSSTAIVLKSLAERGEIGTPPGQLAVGVLLLQDVAVIPVMAILPLIATGAGDLGAIALTLGKALAGMAAVLVAGRYLVPRLFSVALRTRSREVFTLLVVVLLLGTAWLGAGFGLSFAMSAFLAGLILSGSEYGHQALAEVFPVKETFAGIFFTSLGMLLDLQFAFENAGLLLALAALVIVVKAAITAAACRLAQPSGRVALTAGITLGQIGEFSLILGSAAVAIGLLPAARYQVLLGVTILTMLASPFLVQAAPTLASRLTGAFSDPPSPAAGAGPRHPRGHVVIVGYGLNGSNLARVLTSTGISYVVLDMNPLLVGEGGRAGHEVRYGDGTLADVLRGVDVEEARVLVLAISDPLATRQAVAVARRINPQLRIIVRTRFVREIEDLRRLGADEVVAEEFETSIEIFTRVLRELLVPRNVIAVQIDLVRREGYGMLRGLEMPSRLRDQLHHVLAASAVENIQLLEDAPAIGRTIADLQLRSRTGSSIVAVIREGAATTNPQPHWRFELGDVLVLIGGHAEVEAAERILTGPAPGTDRNTDGSLKAASAV